MIDRPDWGSGGGLPAVVDRPAASTPCGEIARPDWSGTVVPAARTERRPTVTAQERAVDNETYDENVLEVSDDSEDAAHLDAEEARNYRHVLARGIFTPEELARHYRLSDGELLDLGFTKEEVADLRAKPVGEVGKPPVTRRSVDAELAEIAAFRRRDKVSYFKDEAIQARERELIALREKLKAAPEQVKQKVETRDDGEGGLPKEFLAELSAQGGLEYHLGVLQRSVATMVDGLEPDEAKAFIASWDALPEAVQVGAYRYLAIAPGGSARPASESALAEFAELEEGAALMKEWGPRAAATLGLMRMRLDLIFKSMSEKNRKTLGEWFDGLPANQAAAVLRALAGR